MKPQLWTVPILLSVVLMIASARSPANDSHSSQEPQARGYWTDPSTGLMWAGKDSGSNVNWKNATKYCSNLRLAGFSDWRLATLAELQGIYDIGAMASGLGGPPKKPTPFTWHVKGDLYLTGLQWSSSRRFDDRGKPVAYAWQFDFNEGRAFGGDQLSFSFQKRALCVRTPKK